MNLTRRSILASAPLAAAGLGGCATIENWLANDATIASEIQTAVGVALGTVLNAISSNTVALAQDIVAACLTLASDISGKSFTVASLEADATAWINGIASLDATVKAVLIEVVTLVANALTPSDSSETATALVAYIKSSAQAYINAAASTEGHALLLKLRGRV